MVDLMTSLRGEATEEIHIDEMERDQDGSGKRHMAGDGERGQQATIDLSSSSEENEEGNQLARPAAGTSEHWEQQRSDHQPEAEERAQGDLLGEERAQGDLLGEDPDMNLGTGHGPFGAEVRVPLTTQNQEGLQNHDDGTASQSNSPGVSEKPIHHSNPEKGMQSGHQVRYGLWNRAGKAKGNLCFMNVGFQLMARILPRQHGQWICSRARPLTRALSKTLARMSWAGNCRVLNPTGLRTTIFSALPQFEDGRQHDALEFLAHTWEVLQQESVKKDGNMPIKEGDYTNDLVADTVAFLESSTLTCPRCGAQSTTVREATHVVLALPPKPRTSLEECLVKHFGMENLDVENAWQCPRCHQRVCAEKVLRMASLPTVAVIGLKRTQYTEQREVCRTAVHSPEQLDMAAVSLDPSNPVMFDLVAVINHHGTDGAGHYTIDVRGNEDETWYHFDDEQVQPSETYRAEEATILVYEKKPPKNVQSPSQDSTPRRRGRLKVLTLQHSRRKKRQVSIFEQQLLRRHTRVKRERSRPLVNHPEAPEYEKAVGEEALARSAIDFWEREDRQRLAEWQERENPARARPHLEKRSKKAAPKRTKKSKGFTPECRAEAADTEPHTQELFQSSRRADTVDSESTASEQSCRVKEQAVKSNEEAEEAERCMILDAWRAEQARLAVDEQLERNRKTTPTQERESQELTLLKAEETDSRGDLCDEWRKSLRDLKEQEKEVRQRLEKEQDAEERQRKDESLRKLEEALSISHYAALGLNSESTPAAVRAAGRRIALECHPDKFPHDPKRATAVFQAVRHAHDTLADPKSRKEYDEELVAKTHQKPAEPSRPEPSGDFGNFAVLSLQRRYGWSAAKIEEEEELLRRVRMECNLYEAPSARGQCWVLLPGLTVRRARIMGNRMCYVAGRTWYDTIVHIEGDSTAISLEPNQRLFRTLAEAIIIRGRALELQVGLRP
jgi:ubiquitin C-terminal hydrolase